ncbi:hypothetical protein BWQ96_04739 [Gracilariopsis chorda]|uniref:Uncharacterized protein n=1 Tax=Gracilariopsis chorda TaxID=448386 RepID=A0A2V3ITJ5_9FLOR|nr:hypothetical protein BWQ96_04739 [Gracilariopsis chorda]|eukprot:PXF45441.1 hypothetical protein BWQ96_04739 [Gracilariopsis chorda]
MYSYLQEAYLSVGSVCPFAECQQYLRKKAIWQLILSATQVKGKKNMGLTTPETSFGRIVCVNQKDTNNMVVFEEKEVLDELVDVNPKRPIGNKRGLENIRHFTAFKRGVHGIP